MNFETAASLFEYDPMTGVIRWRYWPGGRGRANGVAGTVDRDGYIVIRHLGKGYKAHRIAWLLTHGVWPSGVIDHINGKKSDNRISNLRDVDIVTNAQNLTGAPKNGASGLRWVSWFSQYKKWKASFSFNRKRYFIGYFDDPHQAHEAAKRARAEMGIA
jgi:hypothetical protein